jgi:hypothetical protein
MWSSPGVYHGSFITFIIYIDDMPDSLSYSVSSFYADDTEIYASSNNCDDLVDKVNFDLQNIHKWMSFKHTLINLNICLLDHPVTLRIK